MCELRTSLYFSHNGYPRTSWLSDKIGRENPPWTRPKLTDFITGAIGGLERPKHHLLAVSLEAVD